ncbi:MAG TPA: response regulator transcription factor, partial [Actinomycetota bacterium]|nr:response regulator transcription factor [Actinomycetota bacterium]
DLILLDLMLPSLDGLEICRRVRGRSTVPIIMLTARSDSTDIIVGLEVGADDYVTKPFDPRVLIARIRALLRRGNTTTVDKTKVDGLEIDRSSFRVTKDDVELQLTATEFHLLDYLARNRGRVATRQMLLAHVWGYDYLGDSRLVDTAIKRLRQKVEDDPHHPEMITTVRSIGYRLET